MIYDVPDQLQPLSVSCLEHAAAPKHRRHSFESLYIHASITTPLFNLTPLYLLSRPLSRLRLPRFIVQNSNCTVECSACLDWRPLLPPAVHAVHSAMHWAANNQIQRPWIQSNIYSVVSSNLKLTKKLNHCNYRSTGQYLDYFKQLFNSKLHVVTILYKIYIHLRCIFYKKWVVMKNVCWCVIWCKSKYKNKISFNHFKNIFVKSLAQITLLYKCNLFTLLYCGRGFAFAYNSRILGAEAALLYTKYDRRIMHLVACFHFSAYTCQLAAR